MPLPRQRDRSVTNCKPHARDLMDGTATPLCPADAGSPGGPICASLEGELLSAAATGEDLRQGSPKSFDPATERRSHRRRVAESDWREGRVPPDALGRNSDRAEDGGTGRRGRHTRPCRRGHRSPDVSRFPPRLGGPSQVDRRAASFCRARRSASAANRTPGVAPGRGRDRTGRGARPHVVGDERHQVLEQVAVGLGQHPAPYGRRQPGPLSVQEFRRRPGRCCCWPRSTTGQA
jgi:hypothetical protein